MWIQYLTPSFSYVTTHQFLWVIYNNTYCRISNMRDFQFRWCYTLPFPTGNRRRTERGLGSCRVEVGEKKGKLVSFQCIILQFPLDIPKIDFGARPFSPVFWFWTKFCMEVSEQIRDHGGILLSRALRRLSHRELTKALFQLSPIIKAQDIFFSLLMYISFD